MARFLTTLLLFVFSGLGKSDKADGRHSFSLTTFDPDGKLGQVERAAHASSLGTPVVAVRCSDVIIMASPQALPSPLVQDDGTTRFCRISPNIAVSHSGIGSDGRVLVAAAQRAAVEHSYTFDEAIPINLLLEELSLLCQEYTMKPASRPFGCSLIVSYIPTDGDPELYRIEPSGSVEFIKESVMIGSLKTGDIQSSLDDIARATSSETVEDARRRILDLFLSYFQKEEQPRTEARSNASVSLLTATLSSSTGWVVRRHWRGEPDETNPQSIADDT